MSPEFLAHGLRDATPTVTCPTVERHRLLIDATLSSVFTAGRGRTTLSNVGRSENATLYCLAERRLSRRMKRPSSP